MNTGSIIWICIKLLKSEILNLLVPTNITHRIGYNYGILGLYSYPIKLKSIIRIKNLLISYLPLFINYGANEE